MSDRLIQFGLAYGDSAFYEYYLKTDSTSDNAVVAIQRLAAPFIEKKEWELAAEVFNRFLINIPAQQVFLDSVIALLSAPPETLMVKKLDNGVNSEFKEYFPVPTIDGNKLYFCSIYRPDSLGGEDIYVSKWDGKTWGNAVRLDLGINTSSHEVVQSISADGNTMVLFGNYDGSLGRGDIFYAHKTDIGWDVLFLPEEKIIP